MERSHKRGAEAACGRTPPGQPAKKRRVLLTNLSLTPTSAPTASPPASLRPNASVSQRAVCPPSLPGSFAQPSLPQPATPAAPAAACALLCLPSNGLLQAYDPLHVRVRHTAGSLSTRLRSPSVIAVALTSTWSIVYAVLLRRPRSCRTSHSALLTHIPRPSRTTTSPSTSPSCRTSATGSCANHRARRTPPSPTCTPSAMSALPQTSALLHIVEQGGAHGKPKLTAVKQST